MNKNECFEKLIEISNYKDGWDKLGVAKSFSSAVIDRCRRILASMNIIPEVRATIEDSVVFDFWSKKVNAEISVSGDEITGFVADIKDNPSEFVFYTEEDAVNFWNTVVGSLVD